MILNGSNFGNSKENVKVFFNDKEALCNFSEG
ncbi:MAG: hypothetical protein V8R12_20580 [Bacteroides faecis]